MALDYALTHASSDAPLTCKEKAMLVAEILSLRLKVKHLEAVVNRPNTKDGLGAAGAQSQDRERVAVIRPDFTDEKTPLSDRDFRIA